VCIYQGLSRLGEIHKQGQQSSSILKEVFRTALSKTTLLSIEYIEIVDSVTLQPTNDAQSCVLVAVAVRTSQTKTRLIDNIVLGGQL